MKKNKSLIKGGKMKNMNWFCENVLPSIFVGFISIQVFVHFMLTMPKIAQ